MTSQSHIPIKTLLLVTITLLSSLTLATPVPAEHPPPSTHSKPARDVSTIELCQGLIELYRFAELAKYPSSKNDDADSGVDSPPSNVAPGVLPAEMLRTCKTILKENGIDSDPVVMIPPRAPSSPPSPPSPLPPSLKTLTQSQPKYPPPPNIPPPPSSGGVGAKAARLTSTITKTGVTIVMPSRPPPRQKVQVTSNSASTQRRLRLQSAGRVDENDVSVEEIDEDASRGDIDGDRDVEDDEEEEEPIIPASAYAKATAAWPFRIYNSNNNNDDSGDKNGNAKVKAALKTNKHHNSNDDDDDEYPRDSDADGDELPLPNSPPPSSRHASNPKSQSAWQWDTSHHTHHHDHNNDPDSLPLNHFSHDQNRILAYLALTTTRICPAWEFLLLGVIVACLGLYLSFTRSGQTRFIRRSGLTNGKKGRGGNSGRNRGIIGFEGVRSAQLVGRRGDGEAEFLGEKML